MPLKNLTRLLTFLSLLVLASAAPAQGPTAETGDPCVEGKALYKAARLPEARAALLNCVAAGEPDLESLLPLTVMGLRDGRLQEALKYGEMAAERFPDDADARYWYGRALLRNERVEDARSQWNQGLQLNLQHKGILEGLARLALTEGEPRKAYQLLDQMRRQGMDDAWLHRLLADIAASGGLWDQSLVHLQDAMSRETPTLGDYLAASELSLMLQKNDQAVDYCREAVRNFPGEASYGALGEAFFASDVMDSSVIYLRRAVDSDRANPRHRFNLANALEVVGQYDEAEKHFLYFLAARPDDVVGNFNYGIHLEKQGKEVEALYYINRTISLDPKMVSARIVKVQLLEKLSQFDQAVADIQQLKVLDPDNTTELLAWEQRLTKARDLAAGKKQEGKIHLLHMVLPDESIVRQVQDFLDSGADFGSLVTQFSVGPAAAKGGDIGWINPDEMVDDMREAIAKLEIYEISPPIESRGLIHLFKRLP